MTARRPFQFCPNPRKRAPGFIAATAALAGLVACASGGSVTQVRPFPDRPVAWQENDDQHVPKRPRSRHLEDEDIALVFRDFLTREVDRHLALETPHPARDVNALDEVPCSTWFCARHHRQEMSPQAIAAGPPEAEAPVLPLTVRTSKPRGAAPGFQVEDARGRKFLVKLDPVGYPELASGADVVGNRIFHAAGYNVPGAFILRLSEDDLVIGPNATFKLSGVAKRPFRPEHLAPLLQGAARTADGKLSGVAVPWIQGDILGAFDMMGRRRDDPNDRYPHQDRRSLRASALLFGWLNVTDPGALNTLDSYVQQDGRTFVRHYVLDFGAGLGASSTRPKSLFDSREYLFDFSRIGLAFLTLGLYQRDWQEDAALYDRELARSKGAVGVYHPTTHWRPEDYFPNRKIPAFLRMTERDGYWGCKSRDHLRRR